MRQMSYFPRAYRYSVSSFSGKFGFICHVENNTGQD